MFLRTVNFYLVLSKLIRTTVEQIESFFSTLNLLCLPPPPYLKWSTCVCPLYSFFLNLPILCPFLLLGCAGTTFKKNVCICKNGCWKWNQLQGMDCLFWGTYGKSFGKKQRSKWLHSFVSCQMDKRSRFLQLKSWNMLKFLSNLYVTLFHLQKQCGIVRMHSLLSLSNYMENTAEFQLYSIVTWKIF